MSNAQAVPAGRVITASQSNLVATAAHNFMLLQVSIGKCDPMKLSRQASNSAANACEVSGAVPVRTRVGALGQHTEELKKKVLSRYNAVRTYLYENTLPLHAGPGQTRGDRIVAVALLPQVLSRLQILKTEAIHELEEFVADYTSYYNLKKSSDLGNVRDVEMMTPERVRAAFYIDVSPPAPIPQVDLSGLNLPAQLAQEIADRHASTIARQLECAREAAIEGARDHLRIVANQLDSGTRLHQSLIDNAKRHADLLEGIVSGYDNDPRLKSLISDIRKTIVAAKTITAIKNNSTLRIKAKETAKRAADALDKIAKAPTQPATIITGDSLLADLLD